MTDLRINKDGDIVVSPQYDDNGQVVYSLALADSAVETEQMIYERLVTALGNWSVYPRLGNALEDLIGMPNTREVGMQGAAMLMDALTYDGFLSPSQVTIKAVPVNPNEILYICSVMNNQQLPYTYYLSLNLVEGVELIDNSTF